MLPLRAISLLKTGARLVGVLGVSDTGEPVSKRKTRLIVSLFALLAALGWLSPDVAKALEDLVLAILAFV